MSPCLTTPGPKGEAIVKEGVKRGGFFISYDPTPTLTSTPMIGWIFQ